MCSAQKDLVKRLHELESLKGNSLDENRYERPSEADP